MNLIHLKNEFIDYTEVEDINIFVHTRQNTIKQRVFGVLIVTTFLVEATIV